MANTDIKWFSFDNKNAPQLSNTWGCMIDVLDACLVTGFGSQTVLSIIISDGVGVATFGGAHNIKQFQVIEFSGASQSALNAEFKVLGVSVNTIEFLIDLPNQTVVGASCKLASLGWVKKFKGFQKAVYQAKNLTANPYFLRVDNSRDPVYAETYAKFAKVGILQSCASIDDISGNQAPFDPLSPTKNWIGTGSGASAISGWCKWRYTFNEGLTDTAAESNAQSAGNRPWVLIGTEDSFYIINSLTMSSVFELPHGFCVLNQDGILKPILMGSLWNSNANMSNNVFTPLSSLNSQTVVALIDYSNNLVVNKFFRFITGFGVINSGVSANTLKLDSENNYIISPIYLVDQGNFILGEVPLVKCCVSNASNTANYSLFSEDGDMYLACRYRTSTTGVIGALFFKIN